MMIADRDYFHRRAEVERDRASKATCIEAAHAHTALAERYLAWASDGATDLRPTLADEQAQQQAGDVRLHAETSRPVAMPFFRN